MLLNIEEPIPEIFYIFIAQYNPMTIHNLKFGKSFTSSAYSSCINSCINNDNFLKKYNNGEVRYLPYDLCENDIKFYSPYLMTAINDYRIEYDAEIHRLKNFKLYPSRLSAIYAFGDFDTCLSVSKKYNWDINSVKKFKLLKNNPISDSITRVIKVNMEVISLCRYAYRFSSIDKDTIYNIWNSYWSGEGNFQMELPTIDFKREVIKTNNIYEYLIEGQVIVCE